MRLGEERFLVLHMFGALDRENGIELSRRQIVLQPIAQEILGIAPAATLRDCMPVLRLRNGDRGNRSAMFKRENSRCGSVTASDIADARAGANARTLA